MKIRIEKVFVILLVLSFGMACNQQKEFDKEKWMIQIDMDYPYRNLMIDDLINNHQIKGLKYNELVKLLGKPQQNRNDNGKYFYQIVEDYGRDIDPVYTKTLYIELIDSVVTDVRVEEWEKE